MSRLRKDTALSLVTVENFLNAGRERLGLEVICGSAGLSCVIPEPVMHRPGLALSGFFEHFAWKRIQVIGMVEHAYLSSLDDDLRARRIEELFSHNIPCLVFTRGKRVFPEMLQIAEEKGITILRSVIVTRHLIHTSTFLLEDLSAPRCRVHGTMLEVAGVGVFIEGAAGLGKSETALGLIRRGHALVADDLTQFRRDSHGNLLGSAMPMAMHHMEIRGIGIINVKTLFGVAAVRGEKQLDMVVTLQRQGEADSEIDRTGLDEMQREFLGVRVRQLVIPVAPGRDLINLVETAAHEHILRAAGHVAASELDERIKRKHGGGE